ncbi:DUF2274 domain-containing protein [Telmatospirillum sp.]|uniref:DUF2274 domain-containing protein n=1 Tax=Telmatospirillum sp. TaxID=2079197 RepID=UPI002845C8D7|nr:DUF2274 domain-containing protein [Telmatospirillum sp.]MDR3439677.1 DUF2274 domain-containing protein [Telmatospirillum sp.]
MLKLGKLPDRTPVRITITASPELNQGLRDYAALYRATYGEAEAIADLIPFMLAAFLESDRGFAKAVKEGQAVPESKEQKPARRQPRRQVETATLPSPVSSNEEPTP